DADAEALLLRGLPDVPTAECLARDFATFRAEQRSLVERLFRAGRFRLAHPAGRDFLLCHAGVTVDELEAVGVPPGEQADAFSVATALNAVLDRAFTQWEGGTPFAIP